MAGGGSGSRWWPVLALVLAAGCKGEAPRARVAPAPSTISAAAWIEVELAAAPEIAGGPGDELTRALGLLDGVPMPAWLKAGFDPRDPTLPRQLPAAAQGAVAALIRWDGAKGRLPSRPCAPGLEGRAAGRAAGGPALDVIRVMALARAGLVMASGDPEAPAMRAVVRLADRLRGEAASTLEAMVGSAIGDEIRQWAGQLGLPATGSLRAYAPTEDGLRRIIAAEALCSVALFTTLREPAHRAERDAIAAAYHATSAAEKTRAIQTEEDALRAFWIEVLTALRGRAADPAGTDQKLAARADAVRADIEHHPVLAVVAPPTLSVIARLRTADQTQRAWLTPPVAPPP